MKDDLIVDRVGLDYEMITPTTFTNTYINDRLSRIKNPLIHDSIEVPKSRSIHVNMFNDNIEEENYESLEFLDSMEKDRLVFYNISRMTDPVGKMIVKKKNLTQYDMKLKRRFKRTKTVKENDKVIVTNRDLMVFNYKLIYSVYKYTHHRLKEYYVFKNIIDTLIDTINTKGVFLHNLVVFDVPDTIPNIAKMTRLMDKEMSPIVLKAFPGRDNLMMFEFWKMFFVNSESLFDRINEDRYDNTFFVFRNKDKSTMYKLKDILALSKSNEIEKTKIGGKTDKEAAKLFLLSIARFKLLSTLDELTLSGIVSDDTDDDLSEADVDDMLDDLGVSTSDKDDIDEIEDVVISEADEEAPKPRKTGNTFREEPKGVEDSKKLLLEDIETATKNKKIGKAENSRLSEVVDTQLETEFNINGKKQKLKDILDYDNIDMSLRQIPIKPTETILDLEMLGSTNRDLDTRYLKEVYHKDLYNAIYGIQKSGVVINKHTIEEKKSFLGESEIHTIELKPLDGRPSTVKFSIPKIDEDGVYKMSSKNYMLRRQRKDLPIRKTSPNNVLLTSYNGKVFIEKNLYQKDNPSVWISKRLVKNENVSNLILKKSSPFDLNLPKAYSNFGNTISRFKFKGKDFIFDYKNRMSILESSIVSEVAKYETKNDCILIGMYKDSLFYVDSNGDMIKVDKGNVEHNKGNLEFYFDIDVFDIPTEVVSIKILSKYIPIGIVILYYMGLDRLLDHVDTTQRFYPTSEKYKVLHNEFAVLLSDGKLVFNKTDTLIALILSSVPKEITKNLNLEDLNNKDGLDTMLGMLGLSIAHMNNISSMESLFLDNITKDVLKEMKEPEDVKGLLIRAVEMLVDDNYKNPNNISDNSIVRYERIPGLVYKSLSRAVQSYKNRNTLSKAKIQLDPYEIWKAIGDDSTSMLVENNNPITTIKQRDNVTYLGEFGRSRITMTIPTRIMTPEEVGIISEATPDSGDSGISTYLTHDSSIVNLRGMTKSIDISKHSISKALSTSNIINPFIVNDD